MSESAAAVLYHVDAAVARITTNRPEARNALSPEVMEGLRDSFERAAGDPAVRALVRDPVRKGR